MPSTYYKPSERRTVDVPPVHSQAIELWKASRDRNCTLCPLHKNVQTVCMFGNGPVPSQGMIIMDTPDAVDDENHRPLIGQAGQYLDDILLKVKLNRSALYVTNAVKCSPPKVKEADRDALLEAGVKQCISYLEAEIAAVRPKAILTMGPHAYYFFTHQKGLLKERGQAFQHGKAKTNEAQPGFAGFGDDLGYSPWVIPTISPDYVDVNPAYNEAFISDVMMFRKYLLGEEVRPPVELIYVDTLEDWKAAEKELWEDAGKILTFDLETRGFKDHDQPGSGYSQVWCIAFTRGRMGPNGKRTFVVPLEHPDSPFLENPIENWQKNWNDGPLNLRMAPKYRPIVEGILKLIKESRVNGHNVKYDLRNSLGQFARRYNVDEG